MERFWRSLIVRRLERNFDEMPSRTFRQHDSTNEKEVGDKNQVNAAYSLSGNKRPLYAGEQSQRDSFYPQAFASLRQ
jgi:hypothetical protein